MDGSTLVGRMEDDPWLAISQFIEVRRNALGLSRQQFGRLLDVSRATIYNWESGKHVPIERVAQLAQALDVPYEDLLRLHPHAVEPLESPPQQRSRSQLTGIMLLVIAGALVVFTWLTARSDCVAVGAGSASLIGPFTDAYERYGGEVVLGCATNEVEKWGPGVVQQFIGGSTGDSALMMLGDGDVFVIAGPIFWDYVAIAQGGTPDIAGFPVSPILECGQVLVVLLDRGLGGPGALVSTPDRSVNVWLPADLWAAYARSGGPTGPLGAPVSLPRRYGGGIEVELERGRLDHVYGSGVYVEGPQAKSAFTTGRCRPAELAEVARSEIRVDAADRRVRIPEAGQISSNPD